MWLWEGNVSLALWLFRLSMFDKLFMWCLKILSSSIFSLFICNDFFFLLWFWIIFQSRLFLWKRHSHVCEGQQGFDAGFNYLLITVMLQVAQMVCFGIAVASDNLPFIFQIDTEVPVERGCLIVMQQDMEVLIWATSFMSKLNTKQAKEYVYSLFTFHWYMKLVGNLTTSDYFERKTPNSMREGTNQCPMEMSTE